MKTSHLVFLADEIGLGAGLGVTVARTEQHALFVDGCIYFHHCVKTFERNDLL